LGWNSLQKAGARGLMEASPPRSAFAEISEVGFVASRAATRELGLLGGACRLVDGCLHGLAVI
jgi:hypothetical protein